jgi:hypothetical protein
MCHLFLENLGFIGIANVGPDLLIAKKSGRQVSKGARSLRRL